MGEDLILYKANGEVVMLQSRASVTHITQGTQSRTINDEDTLTITIVSTTPQSYDIGDRLTIFGRDYFLNRLPKVKKDGEHSYTYDLEFEGIQYDLMRVTYDLTIDTTSNELQDVSGDSLTGDLERFMTVLIANANRVFPDTWKLGECPSTDADKTLAFSEDDNCLSVLQTLCNEDNFDKEFDIVKDDDGKYRIDIYDEVGQTLPYSFRYGRGLGLYELQRDNVSSANIITRLKVFGSTENITSKYVVDPDKGTTAMYNADRLMLPDATKKSESYIEHDDAVAMYGIWEARKNFDDIKPSYTGVISAIDNDSVLIFRDDNFPFDLNQTDSEGSTLYLIAGLEAKIHFNTGNLAGYEFCINSYDHDTKTFKLCSLTDDRGEVFPSEKYEAFRFKVGDEYKILDIAFPEQYIKDAAEELLEAGEEYYNQNSQPKVQYSLSVTKRWLEELVGVNGDATDPVYNVFDIGDRIQIYDEGIGVDKNIRIKSFTRNILDYYDYKLTISDTQTQGNLATRIISSLTEVNTALTINNLKDPVRARMAWRNAQEVLNMVFDPEGNYYSDKIAPNSIETVMLEVGAKSMQFMLTGVTFQPNYQTDPNVIAISAGVLTHLTIEENIRSWNIAAMTVSNLDPDTPYYIYATCDRATDAGTWQVLTSARTVDYSSSTYTFWVGVLNSVDSGTGVRNIALTYGFTTINGRYITTGRIQSSDGETWFDLDDGEIHGTITFTSSSGDNKSITDLDDTQVEHTNFINSTLTHTIYNLGLEGQLDGVIETWFSTTDPSYNDEGVRTFGSDHIGDIWYNPADDTLQVYISTQRAGLTVYTWESIDDEEALASYRAAYKAQDTADGKRRVFYGTTNPTPPYDEGDLWLNGSEIYVCINAKEEGQAFATSDFSNEYVAYDNTKTVIEGGLVTTGTIQLASSAQQICAGITGADATSTSSLSSPVRIWAGTSFAYRENAPFRVLNDGSLYASSAEIAGKITSSEGNIAGFELSSTGMTATDSGARIEFINSGNDMKLTPQYIIFDNDSLGVTAAFGGQTMSPSSGDAYVVPFQVSINRATSGHEGNVGMYFDIEGSTHYDYDGYQDTGNNALYIAKGKITGFRLQVRRIATANTLSLMDSVIFVTEPEVHITLPSGAEDGQMYFIKFVSSTSGNLYIACSGNDYINTERAPTTTKNITITSGRMYHFIYDEHNAIWQAGFSNCD